MYSAILQVVQVVLCVLLIMVILLQQKGSGIGAGFGGASGALVSTKRGVDLFLHKATIVLSVLFFVIAIASTLL